MANTPIERLVKEIMASNGWAGSVVIECLPDGRGVDVFWRTSDQGGDDNPCTHGDSIRNALAAAAKEAKEA